MNGTIPQVSSFRSEVDDGDSRNFQRSVTDDDNNDNMVAEWLNDRRVIYQASTNGVAPLIVQTRPPRFDSRLDFLNPAAEENDYALENNKRELLYFYRPRLIPDSSYWQLLSKQGDNINGIRERGADPVIDTAYTDVGNGEYVYTSQYVKSAPVVRVDPESGYINNRVSEFTRSLDKVRMPDAILTMNLPYQMQEGAAGVDPLFTGQAILAWR